MGAGCAGSTEGVVVKTNTAEERTGGESFSGRTTESTHGRTPAQQEVGTLTISISCCFLTKKMKRAILLSQQQAA